MPIRLCLSSSQHSSPPVMQEVVVSAADGSVAIDDAATASKDASLRLRPSLSGGADGRFASPRETFDSIKDMGGSFKVGENRASRPNAGGRPGLCGAYE